MVKKKRPQKIAYGPNRIPRLGSPEAQARYFEKKAREQEKAKKEGEKKG